MAEPDFLTSELSPSPRSIRRWVAAVVHHAAWAPLERCLASVREQSTPAAETLVYDTGTDAGRFEAARLAAPGVRWHKGPNLGYAGAANWLLAQVAHRRPEVEWVLLLNPDVALDPDFARNLLAATASEPRVALASGKLLRPGERVIDSAGIFLPRNRRPRDRGSGEPDRGQYERREKIFGVSGAALFLRMAALAELTLEGEIFDEDFFLYHEDTDLAWRAGTLGWEVLYEPKAKAIHERGWKNDGRFQVPPSVRRHSFKNHYLQLIKNEGIRELVTHAPWLLGWEFMRFGYAVLRDPAMLAAYPLALRAAPAAWRKRRALHEQRRRQRLG